jgi:DNA-binding NarL/FixJ family response regulator
VTYAIDEAHLARDAVASVLIVDDHSLITQGLTLSLRSEGLGIHVATEPDVELVVAMARVHRPALALVDLQFHDNSHEGLELIEPLACVTRVLVLTGVSDPVVLGRCLELGAVGVASKAEPFDVLLEHITAALRGDAVHGVTAREELLAASRGHRTAEARRLATFSSLSAREREVLDQLASGLGAEGIAQQTFVSVATVRTHIQAILRKLGVNSQLAAVALAHEADWRSSTPR